MTDHDLSVGRAVGEPDARASEPATTRPPWRSRSAERAVLLFNPVGGTAIRHRITGAWLVEQLQSHGIEVELVETRTDIDPSIQADQLLRGQPSAVIVAAGDSTIHAVAARMVGQAIPLGLLPLGTFNNISQALRIPRDVTAACAALASGRVMWMDVGRDQAGRHFFEAAGAGLDAPLWPLGEQIKQGRWLRLLDALALLLSYRPRRLILRMRNEHGQPTPVRRMRAIQIVVGNCPSYGANFEICPNAVLDDGVLHVTIFHRFSMWELIWYFWSISSGRRVFHPRVEYVQARSVFIGRPLDRPGVPVHLDGVPTGETPLWLECVPRALPVIVPADYPTSDRR